MHLFQQYGQVPYHRLHKEKEKVQNFVYNTSDPPIILFNAIETYQISKKLQTLKNCSNK